MIYTTEENSMNSISESPQNEIEKDFVSQVCEIVMDSLDIGYREHRIVRALLKNNISNELDSHYKQEGLLQQYECYVLDKASERLKEELNLSSEVNHNHAVHAKLKDITDEIKSKHLKEE